MSIVNGSAKTHNRRPFRPYDQSGMDGEDALVNRESFELQESHVKACVPSPQKAVTNEIEGGSHVEDSNFALSTLNVPSGRILKTMDIEQLDV